MGSYANQPVVQKYSSRIHSEGSKEKRRAAKPLFLIIEVLSRRKNLQKLFLFVGTTEIKGDK